ncbi:MAG TPA: PQQ-dependent sugar dehydrogenase, partial [Thermomicrobiales bacterium]
MVGRYLLRGLVVAMLLVALVPNAPLSAAAALAPPRTGPSGAPPPGSGDVEIDDFVRVIDGNTVEVTIGGGKVGVGLLGIDAPLYNTDCGREAIDLLNALVADGMRLVEDPEKSLAVNDRTLRMYHGFTKDGRSIAKELIRAGRGRANGQGRDARTLGQDEGDARGNGRGCLWGGGGDPAPAHRPGREPELVAAATALPPGFNQQVVAGGLNLPTAFAYLPDSRVLIAEKDGKVRLATNGALAPTPFIDISARVNSYWDRGLLGLAVDPNFASNGYVYLLFSYENNAADAAGSKTAQLLRVTASGDTAVPGSDVVILGRDVGSSCASLPAGADCIPAEWYGHSVGNIKFGPDGNLFLTNGDAASWNVVTDAALRAQDINSLAGKVLRITPSGLGVPNNPFYDAANPRANRSKVWALGVRNAFRFNVRPGTNLPYVGDVGWGVWEEIHTAPAGANLGWPCYEADAINSGYEPKAVCQSLIARGPSAVRSPLVAWDHSGGSAAAVGGPFYTGTSYPGQYQGGYFYGDYSQGFINYLAVDANNNRVGAPVTFATGADGPVAIETGPDGDLQYLSINTGELRRIRFAPPPPPPPPAGTGYLSDQRWLSANNGWGPVERDRSNGDIGAGDGRPLTLGGAVYAKGLGVHATSEIRYALGGCT